MMYPKDWDDLFNTEGVNSIMKKSAIEYQARIKLAKLTKGEVITTEQLVELLYPRAIAEKTLRGDIARTGMYKILAALALGRMEDCCRKGDVSGQYMGKPKRPWLWFAPANGKCPTCGRAWEEPSDEIGQLDEGGSL